MADDQLSQRFGRSFPRGTVLFREGEPGKEMFVVQQGRVIISKKVADVEKILSSLGPGEFLGEMSILNDKPRSATATCAEDARDAASRVVHYLAVAAEKVPRGPTGHLLRMAPHELPGRVGVRPEQAADVVANLAKAGIAVVHPDGFLVPDVAKLRMYLELLLMKAQFGDVS